MGFVLRLLENVHGQSFGGFAADSRQPGQVLDQVLIESG
jgi:hypothetical protein